MPHKIILTGIPTKGLRQVDDIYSFDMEEKGGQCPPKGLPLSNSITYTIFCNEKQLRRAGLLKKHLMNCKLLVQGEPILDIPVDKCPGEIGVIAYQVELLSEIKNEIDTEDKATQDVIIQKEKVIPWFQGKENELVEINVDDVILTEEIHLSTESIKTPKLKYIQSRGKVTKPIAVRKLDNGKYALVVGIKAYFQCKILGFKTIQAYITDLCYNDFIKKHNIVEKNTFAETVKNEASY